MYYIIYSALLLLVAGSLYHLPSYIHYYNFDLIIHNKWKVKPLNNHFGVELSEEIILPERDISFIELLLEEYLVVIIRGQNMSYSQQIQFAKLLGPPTEAHPVVPSTKKFPEILEVSSLKGGKNAQWHTDVSFLLEPHAFSLLHAEIIPEQGGNTLWGNLQAAYEGLSEPMKQMLQNAEAVHKISPLAYWGQPPAVGLSKEEIQQLYSESQKHRPVIHPVIRIHPKSKRLGLFVNPGFTSHLLHFPSLEADYLLRFLHEHITKPEYIINHQWQVGDLVIWDNRCTIHYATNNYGDMDRKLNRVTIQGDLPYGKKGLKSRYSDDLLLDVR